MLFGRLMKISERNRHVTPGYGTTEMSSVAEAGSIICIWR
jgi:hypothetical protein